ncbi:MAG: hypothetical protein S4CHLAM20_13480 [Chlamydiia bacterium]|nr:hypothetical protein [Chlamydiia bacterium]
MTESLSPFFGMARLYADSYNELEVSVRQNLDLKRPMTRDEAQEFIKVADKTFIVAITYIAEYGKLIEPKLQNEDKQHLQSITRIEVQEFVQKLMMNTQGTKKMLALNKKLAENGTPMVHKRINYLDAYTELRAVLEQRFNFSPPDWKN